MHRVQSIRVIFDEDSYTLAQYQDI